MGNGLNGKGVAAARLGLSHFVDNRWDVLESVFADKAGNSGDFVRRFDGILFHFASGGAGQWKPKPPHRQSPELRRHYCSVSGWAGVLEHLRGNTSPRSLCHGEEWMLQRRCQGLAQIAEPAGALPVQVRSKETGVAVGAATASVFVRRISVGIEEDAAFGVVKRLIGAEGDHFKFIARESGAKVVLNGWGSPHPQPRSFEQEPLTVCIRAKTTASLEKAITLIEDLLSDICQEHQEFRQA